MASQSSLTRPDLTENTGNAPSTANSAETRSQNTTMSTGSGAPSLQPSVDSLEEGLVALGVLVPERMSRWVQAGGPVRIGKALKAFQDAAAGFKDQVVSLTNGKLVQNSPVETAREDLMSAVGSMRQLEVAQISVAVSLAEAHLSTMITAMAMVKTAFASSVKIDPSMDQWETLFRSYELMMKAMNRTLISQLCVSYS